jgi:hypothetical protein
VKVGYRDTHENQIPRNCHLWTFLPALSSLPHRRSRQVQGLQNRIPESAGWPFITCALRKKGIEFCWDCEESEPCEKWAKHRESAKKSDSFTCYQTLEDDIACIRKYGADEFEKLQKKREQLLNVMLREYNNGRLKSSYCLAATVMETGELEEALSEAKKNSPGLDCKGKSGVLHAILDKTARQRNYLLKLRK